MEAENIIMIVNNFMLQPHEREIIEKVERENHRLVIDRALPLSLSSSINISDSTRFNWMKNGKSVCK